MNKLPLPAPAEAAGELEAVLGQPVPALLRTLPCKVAPGGFGIDGNVVPLSGVGRYYSDEASPIAIYRQ